MNIARIFFSALLFIKKGNRKLMIEFRVWIKSVCLNDRRVLNNWRENEWKSFRTLLAQCSNNKWQNVCCLCIPFFFSLVLVVSLVNPANNNGGKKILDLSASACISVSWLNKLPTNTTLCMLSSNGVAAYSWYCQELITFVRDKVV